MKNKCTVTRGEMGGDNGGKRVKRFQEHEQNQGRVGSGEGVGDGWSGGERRGEKADNCS